MRVWKRFDVPWLVGGSMAQQVALLVHGPNNHQIKPQGRPPKANGDNKTHRTTIHKDRFIC